MKIVARLIIAALLILIVGCGSATGDSLWSIDELGGKIVAAGTFWEEWWGLTVDGRFYESHQDPDFGLQRTARVFVDTPAAVLPSSGFESICDTRDYLLQFYTQEWVDSVTPYTGGHAFFMDNGVLYKNVGRSATQRPNWETASHKMVVQSGNVAIVATTVYHGFWHEDIPPHWENVLPYEVTHYFIFIDGRIAIGPNKIWSMYGGLRATNISEAFIEDPSRMWDIHELGDKIIASGTFWEEWWDVTGRFSHPHVEWVEQDMHTAWATRVLPSSGFDNIYDIRDYLLQFYTQKWVDEALAGEFSPFIEYGGQLFMHDGRICTPRPKWETASHRTIAQFGNITIVETTVDSICPSGMYGPVPVTRRFLFIDGLIHSPDMWDAFWG